MIKFTKEKCIGCHLCEIACSGKKLGVFNPEKANIHVFHEYVQEQLRIDIKSCIMCKKCIKACILDAISEEQGYLMVNPEKCVGCGDCVKVCPNKIIKLINNKAHLCDFCKGFPQCVEWCPREALVFEYK